MRTGLIWKYINNVNTYRCPAHPGPYPDNSADPTNQYKANTEWVTSYLMNGAVSGYGRQPPAERLALFRPDAIYIWEAQEKNAPFNDGSSYPWESQTKRHVTGSTYGCFDGRAEYIRLGDYNDMYNTPRPNRLWCYPKSADGG